MPANRYISASEKSVFLARGVFLLAQRNHASTSGPTYSIYAEDWDSWSRRWPELHDEAVMIQAAMMDFCIRL